MFQAQQLCLPRPMVGTAVANFEYLVEGVLLAVTAAMGVVGNVAFIALFSYHRQRISTFHRY